MLVFASSGGEEVSAWHNAQKHGMFSFYFLKAIHDKNADANRDNVLTAQEIQAYVSDIRDGVPYYTKRLHGIPQNPQLLGGGDRDGVILRYK